jgi:hypothetical protein
MPVSSLRVWVSSAIGLPLAVAACAASTASAPGARTSETSSQSSPSDSAKATLANAPTSAGEEGQPRPSSSYTVSDIAIVPVKTSDPPKPLPKPWIETPGFEQVLGRDWVPGYKVLFKVPNQPAGSYVQFVLDGRPVDPATTSRGGISLTSLAGPDGLSDGEHVLSAHVCTSNGQSVKAPGGISVHRFWIGKKTPGAYQSSAPMLVLGAPFGHYSGSAADEILIDYYVLNAALGEKGHSIRMTLKGPGLAEEGTERFTREWRPWIIVSPHNGEYTLKVELLDPSGNSPPGGTIVRTFKVDGRSD